MAAMDQFFTNKNRVDFQATCELEGDILYFQKAFTLPVINRILWLILKELAGFSGPRLEINLDRLEHIDSVGVTTLIYLKRKLNRRKIDVEIVGGTEAVRANLQLFSSADLKLRYPVEKMPYWENVGEKTFDFFFQSLQNFAMLAADVFYWTVTDLFRSRAHRKGEFVNQAVQIGVNAVPIVLGMSFLIGLVLALQSAAQLRDFGANVFIVNLVVIAMMREMGPLITAILVAGRSGSAIASEIATMKVTEELDALTTMGLNPIRFIVVPKMHAAICTIPFLTILANILGITGGVVVAYLYLDISPAMFFSRMEAVLYFRDIITGLIKSLIFAAVIVLTGSYFGFQVRGGAEGVGRVTTSAVVIAISIVILADSLLGLIFY